MALRLRRGTDAERLIMEPPAAGELIYTTDTKAVWVGDGTTPGGIPVSGAALDLDSLGDVDLSQGINAGDILQYNGIQWVNTTAPDVTGNVYGRDSTLLIDTDNSVIVGPIVSETAIVADLVGDVTGNLVGDVIGDVTGTVTGTLIGNVNGTLDGDVSGSVFADDSSIMLDAQNRTFRGSIVGGLTVNDPTQVEVALNIDSLENTSKLNLKRLSTSDLSGNNTVQYGTISFGRDDVNGILTTGIIFGRENEIRIGQSSTGAFGTEAVYITWKDNKLGLGRTNPTEQLDMTGNAKIDGFVKFGSLTTAERDALTAANGMVIYNSTDNKFQGYENGAWVNLV